MNYRKLIKEEIAKLHASGSVAKDLNPRLDSDLGEAIVADMYKRILNTNVITAKDFFENLDFHNEDMPTFYIGQEKGVTMSKEQILWMLDKYHKMNFANSK